MSDYFHQSRPQCHLHKKKKKVLVGTEPSSLLPGGVYLSVCPAASVCSCLSEVSEARRAALYEATAPSKPAGLHEKDALRLGPSKEQREEFKAGRGELWMESSAPKPRVRRRMGGRGGGDIKGKDRKTLKRHLIPPIKGRRQPASLCISSSTLNLQHEVVILSTLDEHQVQPWRLIDPTALCVRLSRRTPSGHMPGGFLRRRETSFLRFTARY